MVYFLRCINKAFLPGYYRTLDIFLAIRLIIDSRFVLFTKMYNVVAWPQFPPLVSFHSSINSQKVSFSA